MMFTTSPEHVYERQRTMLAEAAELRSARQVRRLHKAVRRAERAERELTRSWCEAARRRAELTELVGDQLL
jgi:hypothetical protein